MEKLFSLTVRPSPPPHRDPILYSGACATRCRLSSRSNLCHRAYETCCQRCNCVPLGTAGNQEVRPCYASFTTHGGKRKCP
ncbi:snakin-2-like [Arachis ipaensis]|uniref:snakin-2-like n=1 Tax=Arachis ipaensis TaxID=130454 RepID=UPI0007AFA913|nr:snakin-2-like [Arachis ipaensis]